MIINILTAVVTIAAIIDIVFVAALINVVREEELKEDNEFIDELEEIVSEDNI